LTVAKRACESGWNREAKEENNKMAVENVEEIKTYLEANKENEGVKAFVATLNPVTAIKTAEEAKAFVEKVPLLKSHVDSFANHQSEERIKNYKNSDEFKQLKADLVKEIKPNETPEQKTIRELQGRLDKNDKDKVFQDKIDAAVSKVPDSLKEFTRKLLRAEIDSFPELLTSMSTTLSADNEKLIADAVELKVKERMANVKPVGSLTIHAQPPAEKPYKDYTPSEKTNLYRTNPEKFKELDPILFETLRRNNR